MHRCATSTIAILILDFMKFEVSEKDFPDFLAWIHQGFVVLLWLHFLLSLVDDRSFAAAMVWVCLAVSKAVSSFSALM